MDNKPNQDKVSDLVRSYAPAIKRIFESEDGKALIKWCEGIIDLPSYIFGQQTTFQDTTNIEGQRTAMRQLLNFRTYKDNTQ